MFKMTHVINTVEVTILYVDKLTNVTNALAMLNLILTCSHIVKNKINFTYIPINIGCDRGILRIALTQVAYNIAI